MTWDCNEGLERACVLLEVATDMIATAWSGIGHCEHRDREYLISRLERAIDNLDDALSKVKLGEDTL